MKLANTQQVESAQQSGSQEEVHEVLRSAGAESEIFYRELEMNSRYVDTFEEISDSNSRMLLHSHNYFEVICCRSVVDVEYLVGADRYRLQKGDIIFITPGVSHLPLLPERLQAPYRRDVIRISQEYMQDMLKLDILSIAPLLEKPFLLRTAGTRWEYLRDLFRWGVLEAEKKDPGWEIGILGNTAQVLAHIYRALLERTAEPLRAEKPELLDQVMDYIENHLSEKITLADVARQFYISQSTITQTFRNKMGISFYRCVTQRRLISAKRMIENEIPLESVSMQVGFKDYSSFYRAFKQEYGISPRQYRAAHHQAAKS